MWICIQGYFRDTVALDHRNKSNITIKQVTQIYCFTNAHKKLCSHCTVVLTTAKQKILYIYIYIYIHTHIYTHTYTQTHIILDRKEIKPVNPKGNQPWIFTERTDAEAEAPICWLLDGKSWFTRKEPDAGKDWGQEEKGMTEDEIVRWHHWLNGHEFEQTERWRRTEKPEVLQFMGSQTVIYNLATEQEYIILKYLLLKKQKATHDLSLLNCSLFAKVISKDHWSHVIITSIIIMRKVETLWESPNPVGKEMVLIDAGLPQIFNL